MKKCEMESEFQDAYRIYLEVHFNREDVLGTSLFFSTGVDSLKNFTTN